MSHRAAREAVNAGPADPHRLVDELLAAADARQRVAMVLGLL